MALLHTQRNTAAVSVDVEDHDFSFVTQGHNLSRVNVLVSPIHFRNVYQTFNTVFDFHEATVISQVTNLTEDTCAGWVTTNQILPRIFTQLLETQGNAVLIAVKFEDFNVNFVTDVNHFGRMLNALPSHIGDVQQAVDAAEIQKCTVIGEVLDHAFDDLTFLQVFHQCFAFCAVFFFHNCAA